MFKKNRNSNQGLIGIDIGSTSIKKLELSRQGDRLRVEDYVVHPLPDGAVENKTIVMIEPVVEILSKIMKSSKAGVAFAIQSGNVFTHIENMDGSLTDQEVQANVNAKLDKIIPLPVSEAAVDYIIADKVHNLKPVREVTIVATKSSAIQSRLEVFEHAGIKTNVATIESFAVEKIVPLITGGTDKTSILFDFGYSTTVIYAIRNNKIVYTSNHDFGGQDLSEMIRDHYDVEAYQVENIRDEKIQAHDDDFIINVLTPFLQKTSQQFSQSLQLCMSSVDETRIGEVGQILLSGGSARISGLVASVEEELGYPVRIACPFDHMDFAPGVDRNEFNKERASLLTACGLALCDVGDSLNLLPWRETVELQKKRSYLTGLTVAGMLGLAVAVGGWVATNSSVGIQQEATLLVQNENQQIDIQLAELQRVTELRDEMLARMKLIQGLQAQRPIMVQVANSIAKSIPENALLDSISKDGSVFTFNGKAKDIEIVSEYMRSLKASGLFTDVFMSNYESYMQVKATNPALVEEKPVKAKAEDTYGKFIITATLADYVELNSAGNLPQTPVINNSSGLEVAEPVPAPAHVAAETSQPEIPLVSTVDQVQQHQNDGGV